MSVPCAGLTDLYFPDFNVGNSHLPKLARAVEICAGCPYAGPCFDGAAARREPSGVWGGRIFENGRAVPMPRPRGRPRKVAA